MAAPNIESRTVVGTFGSPEVIFLTLSPASVGAATCAEQTFTCTGVELARDVGLGVQKPTAQAGLAAVHVRVTADNTIGITFANPTAGAIVPTAGEVYAVTIMRCNAPRNSQA